MRPPLPRWVDHESAFVAVVLVAAGWSALMSASGTEPLDARRTLGFAGGPLVLLAGIHARTGAFLHDPARMRLLPTPLSAARHWAEGLARHRRGLAGTWLAGLLALLAGALAGAGGGALDPWSGPLTLVLDWSWLCLFALGVEPLFAGLAADLGRRLPGSSRAAELQHAAGGGWTQDEAVVHLYAPALAIGSAAALAMPGQLVWMAFSEGRPITALAVAAGLAPLLLALAGSRLGRARYERGVWEAVPWLDEASRTLAGPPLPEPTPAWVARIRDPARRLVLLQLLRATPLPLFRMAAPVAWAVGVLWWRIEPSAPVLAVGLALAALWLLPLRPLVRARAGRARVLVATPLSPARRAGRDPLAPLLASAPLAVALALALLAWSGTLGPPPPWP